MTAIVRRTANGLEVALLAVLFTWLPALMYLTWGGFAGWLGVVAVNAVIIECALRGAQNGSTTPPPDAQ